MMTGGLRVKARPIFYAAPFRIGSAVIEATYAGERNGGRTHRTRLQRYIEIAIDKSFRSQRQTCFADCKHFSVSGYVVEFSCAVARLCDDRALMHDDRTNGDLTARTGSARFC